MRSRSLPFAFAAVLVAAASASSESAPRVVIAEPIHDFGTVEQGAVVEHVFRVKNGGDAPLRVEHVKGTCACTVAASSGEPVGPGDEAWVTVRLDTARLGGRTTKTVTIYTNDPATPAFGASLTGLVLADLVVTPTPLYLGHVRRGAVVTRDLAVVPGRPEGTAAVVAVESTHPNLRGRIEPAPDGHGQRIVVELDASLPLGRFADTLTLRTTSERQPTLPVNVIGTIEGEIAVVPPRVTFGLAQGETVAPQDVFIHNRGARPIRITRVTVPPEATYQLSTVDEGVEYRLAVGLRPGLRPGKIEGAIDVTTTHPDEEHVTIPLYAVVRERS